MQTASLEVRGGYTGGFSDSNQLLAASAGLGAEGRWLKAVPKGKIYRRDEA